MTRAEEIEYAKKNGIPVTSAAKKYSIDQSIWGRSIECGILEDASQEPPEDAFEWTVSPEEAPNKPEYVTIQFEAGVPVELNGKKLDPLTIIEQLNEHAEKHGAG